MPATRRVADWYAELGTALARHVRGWNQLSPDDREQWVEQVLADVESGAKKIRVPASVSASGTDEVIEVPQGLRLRDERGLAGVR